MSRGARTVPLVLLLAVLAEVVVFALVGRWVGFTWATLLLLAVSLLGLFVLRREGVRAWRRFRSALDSGHPPGQQVTDGLVGLAAGLLLTVPGLLTGVAGLLLMAPPARGLVRRAVQRAVEWRMSSAVAGDLFGPRRVRVWLGEPQSASDGPRPDPGVGPTIEGEVLEPRRP